MDLLCLIVGLYLLSLCTAQWCYQNQYSCDDTCRDPGHWSAQFPRCGGLRQSPINIVSSKVHMNTALPPLEFIGHTDRINITVENKGHSGDAPSTILTHHYGSSFFFFFCSLAAHFHLPQSVRLTGGALPGHYRAAQFHFHWGASGTPGSEHTIDGERFPMELHIVHIKEPYGSLTEAEHDMSGIALLAFLFEETSEDHPHLDAVIAALGQVQHNGTTAVIANFQLSDIIPSSKDLHAYYRYVGSMTTPGCEQAVAWTVFHQRLAVSSRQLDAIVQQCRFWTGQPMMDIFRPTQPLDGRVVYRSNLAATLKATRLWFDAFSLVLTTLVLIQ
ncbi:carbonic anhydrase IV c [Dunckerocampus dactyliophorus]|uniref:carbonic anhydrase IV c n=1 Tax=Dunckerocampus dactyliophorus TaxID=161453 RepID=UPI002406E6E5|nr:carbonic anhydrase IV c [Dunckerocampus dactyliophorus]